MSGTLEAAPGCGRATRGVEGSETVERAPAIEAGSNVEKVIERYPATAQVFVDRRLACVGCDLARFETLADVCAIYRQSLDAMLRELRVVAALAPPGDR